MLIEIDKDLYNKMVQIVKLRNSTLYNQVKDIKALDNIPTSTIDKARTVKTDRIKINIKSTLRELVGSNINPTKYKVHKITKIAYITLNKYYDDILDEVLNEG